MALPRKLIGQQVHTKPIVLLNTTLSEQAMRNDLFPDPSFTQKILGVAQTCFREKTVHKVWRRFTKPN